jgi:hypothetical protein
MNANLSAKPAVLLALLLAVIVAPMQAGDNLRLNQRLDYSSDSQDGPLISGDHMDEGAAAGQPNYVIFYGEG